MGEVNDTAKIRAKMIGSGKTGDPFRVDLPTYTMIPGSEEYADAEKKVPASVIVEIPDNEVDATGRPDKVKIRAKYRGQPKWDRSDVTDDV